MNFSTLNIQSLEHVERWEISPSHELLTKCGQQNHTLEELFVLLSRTEHFQAMGYSQSSSINYFKEPEIPIIWGHMTCSLILASTSHKSYTCILEPLKLSIITSRHISIQHSSINQC